MRKFYYSSAVILCAIVCTGLLLGGCVPTQRYEKEVQFSEPLEPGHSFITKTHNGHVHATGIETNQCDIKAKITGWAGSVERAQELCDAVKVRFERVNGDLKVIMDRPVTSGNEGTGVALDVTLPTQTNFNVETHNGAIELRNTTGNARAKTHNGKIFADSIIGDMNLNTHNGEINCQQAIGNCNLNTHNGAVKVFYGQPDDTGYNCFAQTHNGSVDIRYSQDAACPSEVKATTHNGSIYFDPPAEYSAQVTAKTHNGKVSSNKPVTVVGEIKKNRITGTIGSGEGKLYLQTHNGSITID